MYLIEYEAMKFDLSIVCASFTKGSRETRVIREGFCSALIKLNFRSLIRAGCLVLFLRLPFFFFLRLGILVDPFFRDGILKV